MDIIDPVYGPTYIKEKVLFDLMNSAALLRLKKVLQHGITGLIGITTPTTRFDHSVGAMILVRIFNGSLEEQIAALLHDVSHTAFSHVIDYVFSGHETQNYHDEIKEAFLESSDIPEVLRANGYDWREFLHEERFTILEQPAPALCADRIDYFLRDSQDLGLATGEQVSWALSHLIVHNDRIVVDDLAAARWLGMTYISADDLSWANFREVGLYELTAQAIRQALVKGIIFEEDLLGGDEEVWDVLKSSSDGDIQSKLDLISPLTKFYWDEINPDFRIGTKIRTIDPDVLIDGSITQLSQLDKEFAAHRTAYIDRKSGRWPIRVERK